ncbi:MAG: beta-galactosidase [Candidatus Glassbacteria bacterium]|nr:beta-galactosidase [Candidatus Glassbacteria bacterium]
MSQLQAFSRPAGLPGVTPVLLTVMLAAGALFPSSAAAQDDWGRLQMFEDGDLSRWELTGPGSMQLDSTYATQRRHNLRVEFSAGSALRLDLRGLWRMEEIVREKYSDEGGGGWKIYEAFFTDIYSPAPVELLVAFSDSLGGSREALKTLKKGLNRLQFRREQLAGVDFNSLALVEYSPVQPATLYLDNVRTWEYQPGLDERGRMDISYSDSVASPHLAWQRPDAAGPVRGLFVPRAGAGRVMVELMQRFDLQPATVTFEPSLGLHRWAFGDFYGTRALGYDHVADKFTISYTSLTDELESDKPFEVIVLPPVRGWQNMPPELKAALRKRVADGCGLVLIQPTASTEVADDFRELSPLAGAVQLEKFRPRESDQEEVRPAAMKSGPWRAGPAQSYITRNLPLELIPTGDIRYLEYRARGEVAITAGDGSPILVLGSYGKGRVAAFAWADAGIFPSVRDPLEEKNGLPYWEYLYALIGRAVRWAAGRDSGEGIYNPGLEAVQGKGALEISAEIRSARPSDRVRVLLQDGSFRTLADTVIAATGPGRLKAVFPEIKPAGLLIANFWLMTKAGPVVDFGIVSRDFPAGTSVARLEPATDKVALGGEVSGSLEIAGPAAAVALSLTDNRGRLLAVDTLLPGADGKASFSLPTAGCLTRRAVLGAGVIDGTRTASQTRTALFVDRPAAWDDYEVMMYRFMPDIIPGEWGFLDRYMEELGVTAWAAINPEFIFRSNLNVQTETRLDSEESLDGEGERPYREQKRLYLETRDKKYLQRLHCQHDPAYLAEQKKVITEKVSLFKHFSPLSYYCYEEPSYTHYGDAFDLCFSPYCLGEFRKWLKEQYGSLAELNSQWGTRFKDWEQVVPDDTFEAQARGNYSSWADHRTFSELTYAGNYAYVRGLVRGLDPEGLVMMTGTQRTVPHNGYDYYLLDQTIDHTQPYGEPERHRDFIRPGGKITGCTGYGVSGDKLAYEIWGRLFYGHTAGSAIFWQFSTIDPDYRLCRSGRDMVALFREIRHRGLARLLSCASYSPSPVVLFWSMPSIHGAWIQDGRIVEEDGAPSEVFERWESNYESWRWLLEDLAVPYRTMSCQMLDGGWLENSGAGILVLPNTVALSQAGVKAVERFAAGGGVVIGDVQAAWMDGHCRWLKQGALDGLFGLRNTRPRILAPGDNITERPGGWSLGEADPRVRPGPKTRRHDLGAGFPAAFVNTAGKGSAWYLNAFMAGYGRLRQDGLGAGVRASAAALLEKAGYRPQITVRPAGGGDFKAARVVGYDLGRGGHLVGMLKDYRGPYLEQDIDVTLPAAGYLYDVRAGRYLGRGATIHTTIATGEAKLLACLPYLVEAVKISAPETVRPGQAVKLALSLETAEGIAVCPHVFVLEVFDPAGRKLGYYGGNLAADRGSATAAFTTALNDSPGRWRIRARDVASGLAVERYFTLAP